MSSATTCLLHGKALETHTLYAEAEELIAMPRLMCSEPETAQCLAEQPTAKVNKRLTNHAFVKQRMPQAVKLEAAKHLLVICASM